MEGLLLIALGVGLLLTARGFLEVMLEVQPKLVRFNFPRLAGRFPWAADRLARFSSWTNVVFGVVLGVAAIVAGIVLLLR